MNPEAKPLIDKILLRHRETNDFLQTDRDINEKITILENEIPEHQKEMENAIAECKRKIANTRSEIQRLKEKQMKNQTNYRVTALWHEMKSIENEIKDIVRDSVKNVRKEFAGQRRRLYQAIVERDGAVCQRCYSTASLQVDHVLPVALGGTNELENLQILCRRCNGRKHDTILNFLWRFCE